MFAILMPATLSPLIITLLWAERKAKRLGLTAYEPAPVKKSLPSYIWSIMEQLDLVGLILLGASVALILLPLTLSQTVHGGWHNGSIIAMIVVGCVLFLVFLAWDLRFASRPVIAPRLVRNRAAVGAAFIGFFDFVCSLTRNIYPDYLF